ncbi:MAG: hemerythrin domain-containing protein [Bacteroidia bacterium]|nr:hemerythrin domain-containing protein [Bacteroidia bacterium]
MNKTIELLYEEHANIINAIDIVKQLKPLISQNTERYEELCHELLDYFRDYADRYHHHKEELILFPLMSKKNELLGEGVVAEMFSQHTEFREMTSNIRVALSEKQYTSAQKQLEEYTEALLDHIAVENDELFVIAESLFSEDELDKMYFGFRDVDAQIGADAKQKLEGWATSIRSSLLMA